MKKIFICAMLIACIVICGCVDDNEKYSFDEEAYQSDLQVRKQYLLNYYSDKFIGKTSSQKSGFSASAAAFELYETTNDEIWKEKALAQAEACYEDFERRGDCFGAYNATYHYGRFNKYYSEELLVKAKDILVNSTAYGGRPSTTNHALMFAVSRYLVGAFFPEENDNITKYYGEDAVQTDDPTGEKMIRKILKNYPQTGVYECNSDTYFICHYNPLRAIAEVAPSEELKQMAEIVTHNAILTMAPVWLKGHIAVAMERCYEPFVAQNEGGATDVLLWYFFGGVDEFPTYEQLNSAEGMYIGFNLYSDFLPSRIGVEMALDRSETYTQQELHFYRKDRWDVAYGEYCQTFMDKTYGVFSMKSVVSNNYSKNFVGIGVYNWGVKWITDDENEKSTFTIQNYNAPVTHAHTNLSGTIYGQVLQNKGTVIGVYDIPAEPPSYITNASATEWKKWLPNIVISAPLNPLAVIDESYSGRVFLHYGTVMIAYSLSVGFIYDKMSTEQYTEDITKGYFVSETVDASQYPGETPEEQLAYFQSSLMDNFRNIKPDYSGRTKLNYTSIDGTAMEITYGGDEQFTNGKINGIEQLYNVQNYPVQSNPWVKQMWNDKTITYTYKDKSIIFDIENWTVREDD